MSATLLFNCVMLRFAGAWNGPMSQDCSKQTTAEIEAPAYFVFAASFAISRRSRWGS
jgi:hypothetical protein